MTKKYKDKIFKSKTDGSNGIEYIVVDFIESYHGEGLHEYRLVIDDLEAEKLKEKIGWKKYNSIIKRSENPVPESFLKNNLCLLSIEYGTKELIPISVFSEQFEYTGKNLFSDDEENE